MNRHLLAAMRLAVENQHIRNTAKARGGIYGAERITLNRNNEEMDQHLIDMGFDNSDLDHVQWLFEFFGRARQIVERGG